MNKELLEKMSWLYSQGFVPDMWQSKYYDPADGRTWSENKYQSDENDFCLPYFTESCLWNLLPQEIINNNRSYELTINNGYLGYWKIEYSKGCFHFHSEETLENLHTALLDLVIWTVKQGYLKPEVIKND